jgi:hypothetical protein
LVFFSFGAFQAVAFVFLYVLSRLEALSITWSNYHICELLVKNEEWEGAGVGVGFLLVLFPVLCYQIDTATPHDVRPAHGQLARWYLQRTKKSLHDPQDLRFMSD